MKQNKLNFSENNLLSGICKIEMKCKSVREIMQSAPEQY
jgi:hypothetical protein